MPTHRNWRSLVGVGILLGMGWVLVAFNTVRAIQSDASVFSRLVGITIPLALALVLFAGALGITLYGLLDKALVIAGWTVLGTLSVMVAVVLNIVGFESIRPDFVLALFMIVNGAGGGAVLGFLIGLYDAHQQRLQEEWERESERARELSQRLSVLNRVLRHDIRNQAQIISGSVEQLEPTSNQRAAVDRIERATEQLTDLSMEARELQALLDGTDLDRDVIDLVSLVHEAGDTVLDTYPSLTIEYDLPEVQHVHAPPLLRQALKHLLANTVEHNDSEQPRATVTVRTVDSTETPVHLAIEDNGPGIPAHEPILRGDSESPLHHSDGVGLWFVKWLVEDNGGAIAIETATEDCGGTRVTLELPAPPDEATALESSG